LDNGKAIRHEVRAATASDIAEIVRITNLAYVVEHPLIRGDRTDAAEISERMHKGKFLVLEDERDSTKLCAAVFVSFGRDRGYLGMLAVEPRLQGRGLSKALVAAVENECRGAACKFLDLTVLSLRTELFPFYTRLGFHPSATLPYPRPQLLLKPLHMVQMTKALLPIEEL
jgi:GNAT superfamily N-acetyltransferase